MEKKIQLLSLVLAAQVVIMLVFYLQDSTTAKINDTLVFFEADPQAVDELVFTGPEKKSVTLKKTAQGWILPEYYQLPVSESKRELLVNQLLGAKAKWPVATTSASIERFEVDEDKFQRHIQLKGSGEVLAEAYLGTSPGFRKVHIRGRDHDAVYAVKLNTYDVNIEAKDWFDKTILTLDNDVTSIEGSDFSLVKTEQTWGMNQLAEGQSVNADKANELASQLKNLHVTEAVDPEAAKAIVAKTPVLDLKIKQGDKSLDYKFYQEGEERYIKHSAQQQLFKLAKFTVDKLQELNRETLTMNTAKVTATADKDERAVADNTQNIDATTE